jgi:hypothetical protein
MVKNLGEFIAQKTSEYVRSLTKVSSVRGGFGRGNPEAFEFNYLMPSNKINIYAGMGLRFEYNQENNSVDIYLEDSSANPGLKEKVISKLELYSFGTMQRGYGREILPISDIEHKVVDNAFITDEGFVRVNFKPKDNVARRISSDERAFSAVYKAGIVPILKAVMECKAENSI